MILFLYDKLNYVSSSINTQTSLKSSRRERKLLHSPKLFYWQVKNRVLIYETHNYSVRKKNGGIVHKASMPSMQELT
jgi:hypothetical protein